VSSTTRWIPFFFLCLLVSSCGTAGTGFRDSAAKEGAVYVRTTSRPGYTRQSIYRTMYFVEPVPRESARKILAGYRERFGKEYWFAEGDQIAAVVYLKEAMRERGFALIETTDLARSVDGAHFLDVLIYTYDAGEKTDVLIIIGPLEDRLRADVTYSEVTAWTALCEMPSALYRGRPAHILGRSIDLYGKEDVEGYEDW
jgi:hypothetical protein